MFIKEENICSAKFVSLIVKYLLYTVLLIGATAAILILDGYLKTLHARNYPEEAE